MKLRLRLSKFSFIPLFFLLANSPSKPAHAAMKREWSPNCKDISQVEKDIQRRITDVPLDAHVRLYAGTFEGSDQIILGRIIKRWMPASGVIPSRPAPPQWKPGVYLTSEDKLYSELPESIGSCPVWYLRYSMKKREVISLDC
jgi:hypothetical protein